MDQQQAVHSRDQSSQRPIKRGARQRSRVMVRSGPPEEMSCQVRPRIHLRALLLATLVVAQFQDQAACFWFADSSLFQPPPSPDQVELAALAQRGPDNPKQVLAQECQCNSDWIKNETHLVLARWLSLAKSSSTGGLVSNSTGAPQIIVASAAGRPNGRATYWMADQANNNNTWTKPPARGPGNATAWPRSASARHSRHGQQPPPQPPKLVQGERGLQGPKGDTGGRGERGPPGRSGLIVVRDRRELFERLQQPNGSTGAGSQQTIDGHEDGGSATVLAFVEADQMLVVRTKSGWRPLQLLRPLEDASKAGPGSAHAKRPSKFRDLEDDDDDWQVHGSSIALGATKRVDNDNDILEEDEDADEETDDDDWDVSADEDETDNEEDDDDDDEGDEVDEEEENEDSGGKRSGDDKKATRQRVGHSRREPSAVQRPRQQHQPSPKQVGNKPIHLKVSGRSAVAPLEMWRPPAETSVNHQGPEPNRQLKLRLAALNEPFSGNIHGVRGADFECKRNAAKARLRGSFRALLATSFQNLNELVRLQTHKYPIVNLRGETLASSWNDLFKHHQQTANPLSRIYSFDGRHVATDSNWPNKLVWHGAANKAGYRDLANNCDGWHSDSLNKFGSATPLHNPRNQPAQQQQQQQQPKRRHKKRFAATNHLSSATDRRNSTGLGGFGLGGSPFFEPIEKYPCRMPLVVLCIETVGQQLADLELKQSRHQQLSAENSWDSEMSNSL